MAGLQPMLDQGRDARPHRGGIAVAHQLDDGPDTIGVQRLGADAEVGRAADLDLAHGHAAHELAEIFAEAGLQDQRLQLAEATVGVEPLGPALDLPERLHIGGEPGEAMGGELLGLQQVRIHAAVGAAQAVGHRRRGALQQLLGRLRRRRAGGQEVGKSSFSADLAASATGMAASTRAYVHCNIMPPGSACQRLCAGIVRRYKRLAVKRWYARRKVREAPDGKHHHSQSGRGADAQTSCARG